MSKQALIGISVVLAVVVLAAAAVASAFVRDMERAYARIESGSALIASPWGDIEYSQGGSGPAVLVIHGSGGGFDQGELLARSLLGERVHWVAPSRFGYLRSGLPAGASFDEQAHAYAHLLDHLQLGRVAVVALSHGGPSALLFAALHPERVSSLTLLSAGVASSAEASQAGANAQGDALTRIYQRDLYYWAITQAARGRFLRLMGASAEVVRGLDAEQRRLVDDIVDGMNPVTPRAAGVRFDNRATLPNERIAAIRAPTLILHARDDSLQLFRNAEFAAATIPGARLLPFERGGHLLVAVQLEQIREAVQGQVLRSAVDTAAWAPGQRASAAGVSAAP